MIRTLHRTRGASALGARHPGEQGPFGPYGADEDDDEDDEPGSPLGEPTTDFRPRPWPANPTEGAAP